MPRVAGVCGPRGAGQRVDARTACSAAPFANRGAGRLGRLEAGFVPFVVPTFPTYTPVRKMMEKERLAEVIQKGAGSPVAVQSHSAIRSKSAHFADATCGPPEGTPTVEIAALTSVSHSARTRMTDARIEDLARSIAREAGAAPVSPGRAVAAIVRHRLGALPEEQQTAVRSRALQYLRTGLRTEHSDWLTVAEAAALLRTTERALKRAFRSTAGRRAYGWPQWRNNRWWVARQAVDPQTAPAFFASLPRSEPWPRDSLPEWVE